MTQTLASIGHRMFFLVALYGVYISQLVRYIHVLYKVFDFDKCNIFITGSGTTTMCNSSNFLRAAVMLLSAPLSAVLIDRQVCLTWNATGNELSFKCLVLNLQTEVLLIDAFDNIRANCSMHNMLHCVKSKVGDKVVIEKASKNELFLVLRTQIKDVDGNWKCRHGSREANVDVLTSKGAVYSADVHLSGKVTEIKNHTEFNLTCFSCWTPYSKSVTFFVNDVLEDSISYNDGKCYHKRTLCKPRECTCSTGGHTFSWIFNDDSSYKRFTCEMRFIGDIKSQIIIHTATLLYNGTELTKEINGTSKIQDSYENISNDHENDSDSDILVYSIGGSIVLLVILGVITTGYMLRCISPKQDTDICATCKQMPIDAICADCYHAYCHNCATEHLNHQICQINNVAVSETRINCKKCTKKLADFFCKLCWIPNCDSCYENHSPKGHTLRIDQGSKRSSYAKQVKYKFNIPIRGDVYPVRICGIAYVADGLIIVVDCNNCKLIVFKSRCQQREYTLKGEPRAMTAMMGNKIAITFSNEKQIQFFEISENCLNMYNTFDLKSLKIVRPTPFSIAYDQGYLAVEVGEGEDGRIIILDSKLSVWKTVQIGSQYAFFTGSTIRLALDMSNDGRIYISSMSKKMVSCIDLKGEKLWTITVLSPRSIVILPQEHSSAKRIILSSRKCDTIFELNRDNGTDEMLLTKGKINSPRYMTYNSANQNLCIQVSKKNHEDELVVFDLDEPDNSNPSTPLIENET